MKKYDLSGKTFHWLKVLEKSGSVYDSQTTWLCRCVCGKEIHTTTNNLRQGFKKSCGCKNWHVEHTNRKRTPAEASYYALIDHLKAMAKRRKKEWSVSHEYALVLVKQNCFYCGAAPNMVFNSMKNRLVKLKTAPEFIASATIKWNGLDRIDSLVDYVPGNLVPCCYTCNVAKNIMPINVFIDWIRRVYHHIAYETTPSDLP